MWDVIPNKKGPIKMLTQKMQETITRFKKNRKAATLTQEEALQKSRSNLLKPLVETLILSRLCRGDSYGYEIARSVEQGSGGQLRIPEGAMYPTLYRMMERGYITEDQRAVGGGGCAFIIRLRPPGVCASKGSWMLMRKSMRAMKAALPP